MGEWKVTMPASFNRISPTIWLHEEGQSSIILFSISKIEETKIINAINDINIIYIEWRVNRVIII